MGDRQSSVVRGVGNAALAHARLERALALEPGPSSITALSDIDPRTLDDYDRVRLLQAWESARGWVEAQGLPIMVAVAGAKPADTDEWVREEVAAACNLSGPAAQTRIDVARACVSRVRTAAEALASGRISWLHLRVLAAETADLTDDEARAVTARVLSRAGDQTVGQWRVSIRRAIHAIAPVGVEDAHAVACTQRKVQFWELPHGMAALYAELPAPDALTVWNAINLIARRAPDASAANGPGPKVARTGDPAPRDPATGEAATCIPAPRDPAMVAASRDPASTDSNESHRPRIDSRRADALVELAERFLGGPDAPRAHGRVAELQVSIDLPTLLGLRDDGVAELVGYGPIPVSVARELAGDAKWRRLVTDPVDGHLLDYGATTYAPPRKLRDYIVARDRTCRMVGCRQPAHRNDIDHAHPFDPERDDGPTSAANLGSLCRRHHRLKTLGLWELKTYHNGAATWISAAGHRYDVPAGSSP